MKCLVIGPGARLSLQYHRWRSEHWVILSGTALATVAGRESSLRPNDSLFVPACTVHRLRNPDQGWLRIIEVQTGELLAEDDIVRLEDDYGRSDRGPDGAP